MPQTNKYRQDTDSEIAEIQQTIANYHLGFTHNKPEKVLASLGQELTIFEGSSNGEIEAWKAHLYLSGSDLQNWLSDFLGHAGPYQNDWQVLHTSIRGNAALVKTIDTGSNRFRHWKDESVTWLLGRQNQSWKIVGYFIQDVQLPTN